ncbi:MAG: glycosyltransferase [Kiritimatiellaceae bacterium]|nr:glycosyltransferase [Kiritimatiellaceae bacterium]
MPTNSQSQITNNPPKSKRLRVLISAYACEPGKGSEAGVGWNMALQMSRLHDVHVITRANNRGVIEKGLPAGSTVQFIYYDLPKWAMWWKRGLRGAQLYYYLWQIFSGRMLKNKYAGVFDVGHHVTYVRYWMPTSFPMLGIPYLIGPVGGGEFAPMKFENRFALRPLIYEKVRRLVRTFVPLDPFVRASIAGASFVLSTTKESARKIQKLKARRVEIYPESGLRRDEFDRLACVPGSPESNPMVFVSSGRLLALKGFEMGLRAFARAGIENAKYWFIGDGPERKRIELLAEELGITKKVSFKGWVKREEGLRILSSAHVLVHPSLHDSGGWVCPEAMAMGKAVICLNLGGPGAQVTDATGIRVEPAGYEETIERLAQAMKKLAADRTLLRRMGEAGRREVAARYIWENKCEHYSVIYRQIADQSKSGGSNA